MMLAALVNSVSTLDIVSGGRLGLELGTARERSDRFEEACCEVLVSLLSARPPTSAVRTTGWPAPVSEPKGPSSRIR